MYGFTLIELLVVIAILGILAGFVFSVGGSVMLKSQIKNTQGTILALTAACEQYRAVFDAYPNLDYPPTSPAYQGSNKAVISKGNTSLKYTEAEYKEFNKRLRFMLEDTVYVVDEIRHGPFLNQSLPKTNDESDNSDNTYMYADAWGNFLRICPGRDHTKDTPKGSDNKGKSDDPKYRTVYPIDIFSMGPNMTNDVDRSSDSTQLATKFSTNLAGYDDVVSWITEVRYVEQNYGAEVED